MANETPYNISMPSPVILTSPTLPFRLRTPLESDAEEVMGLFSNPANSEYDSSLHGIDWKVDMLRGLMKRWQTFTDPPNRVSLIAVELAKDEAGVEQEKFVGMGGMGWIGDEKDEEPHYRKGWRCGDVGIMLNPEARGKGFGKEAVRLTIEFAFEVLRLDVVTLETMRGNGPFRGLMTNFKLEEVLNVDEKGNNTVKWFLKRSEWENGKGKIA